MKLIFFAILIYPFFISGQLTPNQPTSGPGGSSYTHTNVIMSDFTSLFSGDGYWLFEPDSPKPDSADVVIFNHGWGVYNPGPYGQWIEHLVKKGNIVIFPKYEQNDGFFPTTYTPNAATGITAAFSELSGNPTRVKPRMNHIAMIGHSFGGVVTANLAIEYNSYNVPKPDCFMLCEPGPGSSAGHLTSYANMETDYKALIVVGNDDIVVGNTFGKMIFDSTLIPTSQKNYIIQYADTPPIIEASHNEPLAANLNYDGGTLGTVITGGYSASKIDAVDYYCYWKLADALLNCTFYNTDCNYAFGNTNEQRFMGTWSDGTPVIELEVFPASNNITETEWLRLNYFPNPVINTLSFSETIDQLNLFTVEGKELFTSSNTNNVDLSHLDNGIYIAYVSVKGEKKRIKLIKQ